MRITLTTYGGLAATVHRGLPPKVVDSDLLQPDAVDRMADAVAAAEAEQAARSERDVEFERAAPRRAPDAMSYEVTVEDGARSFVLTGSDAEMSPAFAALLELFEDPAYRTGP